MDIRQAFLDYFKQHGHAVIEASPLVPDDATLLFTNAGMVQFKPVFVGEVPAPNPPRATTSQTCLRAGGKHNDLENVGYTARHHTFFEMLGNFSFGDYFKEEAIAHAWRFLTETISLSKEKLWISVHESDDEAEAIWLKYVPKERIKRMGDKDNFWQMGDTGPCGPCSEIYVDQGAEHFSGPEDYFGGDGDRFLEVWNLVFMQYNRDEKGVLHPLPKPSIDTGMGLERITAIKEGVLSNYDSSLFKPLLNEIAKVTGKTYDPKNGASHRVIADHIRAVTFLLAQGVNFDKEGRGYVLRRILRRAVRHGYLLGMKTPFMYRIVPTLVDQMSKGYPYLRERQSAVMEQMQLEEERFFATIENGMKLFNEEMAKKPKIFSGETAFKLYDTYGFPLDLTEDMLRVSNTPLDTAGFDAAMKIQRESAKAAWKGSGDAAKDGDFKPLLEQFGENRFVGYDRFEHTTEVLALLDDQFKQTAELKAGSEGWVMLKETPFYATGGGQAGDTGLLENAGEVLATEKFFGLNLSRVKTTATLKAGAKIKAVVGRERVLTARHHSATHLLHTALNETLGDNASQAGSSVDASRLRFDFNYPKAVSPEQLEKIEKRVNELVWMGLAGQTREMAVDEAKKAGAKALFGEKYGSSVRVVSFGDASIELCGGCHVQNTAEIGLFVITKESGVSAGVRRIEAVVSESAYEYLRGLRTTVDSLRLSLKTPDPVSAVEKLQTQIRDLKKEIEKLQSRSEKSLESITIGDVTVVIDVIDAGDAKAIVDDLKNQHEKIAAMIFVAGEGKVSCTAGVKNASVKAGEWVREVAAVLGGKGGGRDDFASGGGAETGAVEAARTKALEFAKAKLG
ncbi:MAG: alanine--tRNA ligase [Campylobacterales bacterium]